MKSYVLSDELTDSLSSVEWMSYIWGPMETLSIPDETGNFLSIFPVMSKTHTCALDVFSGSEKRITVLTPGSLAEMTDDAFAGRAFSWRGRGVLERNMKNAACLAVELEIGMETGNNWFEAH